MKKSGFAKGVFWTLSIGIVVVIILAAVGMIAYSGYTNASLEASYSIGDKETKIKIEKKDKLSSEIASVDKKQVKFNEDLLKDKIKLNFKESGPFYGIKENGRMVRGILKGFQNKGFKTDFYGLFTKNQLYWKGYSEIKYDDGRVLYQYNEYKLDENGKVIIDKDGIYQLVDSYLISEEDFAKVRKYIAYDISIPFKLYDFEETKTNLAKKKSEESTKNENQKELIKIQINGNKKYEDIISDLKIDENFITTLEKKNEFEDISVEIKKFNNEKTLSNGKKINTIQHNTSYAYSDKLNNEYRYIKVANINYPAFITYGDGVTSGYYENIPEEFSLYSDHNNSKYLLYHHNWDFAESDSVYIGFNKPLESLNINRLTKKHLNYLSLEDATIEYVLTPKEKIQLNDFPKVITYNPYKSNKFEGLCSTPEKYNNFFKNNYEEKNCEELYLKIIKGINLEYIDKIKDFQTRLVTKLKNPAIKSFKTDEKYYALVIGNNNYEYLEKLDAAENDAEVIADVLTNKYGFEVDLLLNADYEKTVDTLFKITNKLKRNDNLLIYYAGHGELDKAENRGYWLPVDASYEQRSKWISNQRIVDRIKATKAKHVLLIADSCFSGTLMRSGTNPDVNEAIDEKYIERLKSKKTRLVITSGGNEPVVDSDGGDHSLFAFKLIDTLKNNNTVINSQMLFENIRRYVVSNADQTPERALVHKTGHDGGDFLFFPKE